MNRTRLLLPVAGLALAGALCLLAGGTDITRPAAAQHTGHTPAETAAPPPAGAPAEDAITAEPPTVEIPADRQQLIGVTSVAAARQPIGRTIRTVGRVEYDERKFATVNTKFEGWIEKLHADYTGKRVRKGEPLAEIYSPELLATQQEILSLRRWAQPETGIKDEVVGRLLVKDAEAVIAAARQRLRLWDISDEQIRLIETTEKPLRTVTLHSPADGFVVTKTALQGMRVMPGEKLFDIADVSTVWITADIYEHDLSLVKPGTTARISLSAFPGREFIAPVEFVYPSLAGEARTVKARFSIPNPDGNLKPQMFTNVEIRVELGERLAVPDDAVLDTGTRQIIYVDKGDGYFEPRQVRTGLRADGYREILAGLQPGEKVARSATFLIDSEAQLKGVTPTGTR